MKKISKILFMFVGAFVTMVCGLQNVFAATLNYDFSGATGDYHLLKNKYIVDHI